MDLMSRRRALMTQAQKLIVLATATGNPMTFTTDLVRRLHSLVIPFSPVQAAGTPSPDNPLPISGWTGANVYNETAYNASASPKLTINWQSSAGTIYGGTITLNEDGSADVVADMAWKIFDGTDAIGLPNWRQNSTSVGWLYRADITPGILLIQSSGTNLSNIVCDKLATVSYSTIYTGTSPSIAFVANDWGIVMRMNDTSLTTESAINAWLNANPVTVVYKLATPQSYHIPDVGSLTTYLDTNTIWTDTNGINTVEYWIKNT